MKYSSNLGIRNAKQILRSSKNSSIYIVYTVKQQSKGDFVAYVDRYSYAECYGKDMFSIKYEESMGMEDVKSKIEAIEWRSV